MALYVLHIKTATRKNEVLKSNNNNDEMAFYYPNSFQEKKFGQSKIRIFFESFPIKLKFNTLSNLERYQLNFSWFRAHTKNFILFQECDF